MDPQAAWDRLQDAYCEGDWEEVRELAESLLDWLNRGGFSPVTTPAEPHDTARQRAEAARFCRSVLQQADESSAR